MALTLTGSKPPFIKLTKLILFSVEDKWKLSLGATTLILILKKMSHELLKIIILNDDTWEAVVGISQYINFISGFQAAEILLC